MKATHKKTKEPVEAVHDTKTKTWNIRGILVAHTLSDADFKANYDFQPEAKQGKDK